MAKVSSFPSFNGNEVKESGWNFDVNDQAMGTLSHAKFGYDQWGVGTGYHSKSLVKFAVFGGISLPRASGLYIPTKREFVMKKYSTGSFLRVKFGMKESTTGIASHAKFGLGMQRCNTISAIKNGARARQCRPSVMACVSVSIVAKNNEIP